MLRSHHLDKYGIDVGILIAGDLFGIGGLPDADMAAAFIAANNDWLLHEWCEPEPRLKLAIHVGPRDTRSPSRKSRESALIPPWCRC